MWWEIGREGGWGWVGTEEVKECLGRLKCGKAWNKQWQRQWGHEAPTASLQCQGNKCLPHPPRVPMVPSSLQHSQSQAAELLGVWQAPAQSLESPTQGQAWEATLSPDTGLLSFLSHSLVINEARPSVVTNNKVSLACSRLLQA